MSNTDMESVADNPCTEENDIPRYVLQRARLSLSIRFLDEVLLVRLKDGSLSLEEITALHSAFQKDHRNEVGNDFTLIHTLGIVFKRDLSNRCLAEHAPEKLPQDAVETATAVFLLQAVVFGCK